MDKISMVSTSVPSRNMDSIFKEHMEAAVQACLWIQGHAQRWPGAFSVKQSLCSMHTCKHHDRASASTF